MQTQSKTTDMPSKGENTSLDQLDESDRGDLASLVAECELALSEGYDEFELEYPLKKPEKDVTFFGLKCPVVEVEKGTGLVIIAVKSQELRDAILNLYPQLSRLDISMALEELKKSDV